MKILDIKILNRYTVQESPTFDIKIYVKFVEGFWRWKKITEHTVCRYNTKMHGNSNLRWNWVHTSSFYYPDGKTLEEPKAELLRDMLSDIKRKENLLLFKAKLKSELNSLESNE